MEDEAGQSEAHAGGRESGDGERHWPRRESPTTERDRTRARSATADDMFRAGCSVSAVKNGSSGVVTRKSK